MSSTTLAPSKFGASKEHRHQSALASCGKSNKPKTPREVVLHHPMVSLPPEDWILYPDEVIVTKHSSVRRGRSCKIKDSRSENSRGPSTRVDPNRGKTRKYSHVYQDMQLHKEITSAPRKSPNLLAPAREDNKCDAKTQPKPKFPERLPTPDLSDIEEDSFWSCCGSSESSA